MILNKLGVEKEFKMTKHKRSIFLIWSLLSFLLCAFGCVFDKKTDPSNNKDLVEEQCKTYKCDSLAVRAILDSNGLFDIPVDSVSNKNSNGRIDKLEMRNIGLTNIPKEIKKNGTFKT